MAKTAAKQPEHELRRGDGIPIDVTVTPGTSVDGVLMGTMNIDLNRAPVPDRRYVAETISVVEGDRIIKLVFGQRNITGPGFLNLLIVQLNPSGLDNLKAAFVQLKDSLDALKNKFGILPSAPTSVEGGSTNAVALAANFVAVAIASDEACLDFYRISPFSIRSVHLVKKAAVEPVVRVDLGIPLLMSLIDQINNFPEKFPLLQR